jgi:hypothetical protein
MTRLNTKTPSVPPPGVSKVHKLGFRLHGILAHVRQLVNELQAAYILHRANRATARRIVRQHQALYAPKSSSDEKGGQR